MELCEKLKSLSELGPQLSTKKELQEAFAGLGAVSLDKLGNVIVKKAAKAQPQKVIVLDAHADEVGLVVVQITKDGFLKVAPCGGLDPKVCYGAEVVVFGETRLNGVVCTAAQRQGGRLPATENLFVDLGLQQEEAEKLVPQGSKIAFRPQFLKLENGLYAGKALDNRVSCAVAWRLLEILQQKQFEHLEIDVVLSDLEEVGGRALGCALAALNPTDCIVLDTTFGRFWGSKGEPHGRLGAGPMLGVSPILNSQLTAELKQVAEQMGKPYQIEVMGGKTSTNADEIIPVLCNKPALLSVPIRYMHSPVEVVSLEDVETTAQILAEFLKMQEGNQTREGRKVKDEAG